MASRPSKRLKLDAEHSDLPRPGQNEQTVSPGSAGDQASIRAKRVAFLNSISRAISPPPVSRSGTSTPRAAAPLLHQEPVTKGTPVVEVARREHDGPPNLQPPPSTISSTTIQSIPTKTSPSTSFKTLPSPFRLTSIRDLPASQNIDTISLHDILGNPLIKEAWIFNFCFDVDWLMDHLDPDTRAQVKVKVVHGSWRTEDGNRLGIEDACRRWPNVESVTAYLPDPFGTHHSKMFILFTHDDLAQVVIHTANMLQKDWTNMTQAVWQSPMLPKTNPNAKQPSRENQKTTTTTPCKSPTPIGSIGTGSRFKHDLMSYLAAYGSKLKSLREQLVQHDFSHVRGALIASVPSRMKTDAEGQDIWNQILWGYPSLFRVLETIRSGRRDGQKDSREEQTSNKAQASNGSSQGQTNIKLSATRNATCPPHSHPHVVCQVSSIATLPVPWLNQFFPRLCSQHSTNTKKSTHTFYHPKPPRTQSPGVDWTSATSIIYPTPANVATSLDGYASGGSIHTKAQTAAHLKQITSLRKSLCQWTRGPDPRSTAGRHLAAPHIKTYIRYQSKPTPSNPAPDIDWALLTSANLSTQAWGVERNTKETKTARGTKTGAAKTGAATGSSNERETEVVVQSFEIGVLVWPEVFGDEFNTNEMEVDNSDAEPARGHKVSSSINTDTGGNKNGNSNANADGNTTTVRMVPVFGRDTPTHSETEISETGTTTTVVGLRVPYDLPLTTYGDGDMPWSPQGVYDAPDRHGRRWPRDFC